MGCLALIMGGIWLACSIRADLGRDGYAAVLLSAVLYTLWIGMAGWCFQEMGGKSPHIRKGVLWLWFAGYLYLLARFTLFETAYHREIQLLWSVSQTERQLYLQENINLVPFRSIQLFCRGLLHGYLSYTAWFVNILGNLSVFVPMPFFLLCFSQKKNSVSAILQTAGIVAAVELLQLITMCGRADVDDFLLNILGAAFSVCLWKGIWRGLRGKE